MTREMKDGLRFALMVLLATLLLMLYLPFTNMRPLREVVPTNNPNKVCAPLRQ